MEKYTLKDVAIPLIKAIDTFNFLLKNHHRRVAIISYQIGRAFGLDSEELANLVVAASIHDIGALSVEERNHLIREDVEDPDPHCIMAYRILSQCEIFKDIAHILRYHHISYDLVDTYQDSIPIQSHILHLSDRIDIYLDPNQEITSQADEVTEKIHRRVGHVFHPDVFQAFQKAVNEPDFWSNIETVSMDDILNKVNFTWDIVLDKEQISRFSTVLSRIVDYRSHYTATHSYTVGRVANRIGQILKLDDEYCFKLLIAGNLHDIGKLGINPGIIEKNGPLTEDEYVEMKTHTSFTAEILDDLTKYSWFSDIVTWAKHHHEKSDGSGYPEGLERGKLDLGSFIVAYSDIISALLEDRPYRSRMTPEEMLKVLKNKEAYRLDLGLFKQIKRHLKEIVYTVRESQFGATRIYQAPLADLLM